MTPMGDWMRAFLSYVGFGFVGRFKPLRVLSRPFIILLPYVWHIIFFLIPFLIVLRLSFSDGVIGVPPYTKLMEWGNDGVLQIRLYLSNYQILSEDTLYWDAYVSSVKIAAVATILCLLVAYPMAYGLSRMDRDRRIFWLMLVILPFWTSFLIRVYAWIGLLNHGGVINSVLLKLNVISEPLQLINNDFAVCVGIVYSYLPFMILPIYASLDKMDNQLLEASYDLGARPFKTFWTVTLPLSFQGVVAGSMLVFIPAIGEFVIPELLGGSDTLMIGRVLWSEFFNNRDWPMAATLAVALLSFLVVPIVIFQKLLGRGDDTYVH